MENHNRELSIRMEEAEKELTSSVNHILAEYNLPFFLVEPAFEKIYRQIKDGKAREIADARAREASASAERTESEDSE